MFKNLTDNAKNLAANAKIEDMGRLFKNHMAGKQDVKSTLSGVMDISKEVRGAAAISMNKKKTAQSFIDIPILFLQFSMRFSSAFVNWDGSSMIFWWFRWDFYQTLLIFAAAS